MALELLALIGEYYEDNYLAPNYNNPLLGEEDKKRRDRRTPRIAIKRYSHVRELFRGDTLKFASKWRAIN
eukprot:jgi/Psemu1/20324/gm1.20324_g